jgi:hypothetical protein
MPVDVRILIRLDRRPTLDEMKEWNRQLLGRFKDDFFLDDKPLVTLEGWEFDIIEEYPQSTWLESNWARNYYGVGYERGDFALIIHYIDALQEMIPSGVIYYGPDSVDDIELFSDQRQKLNDHWDQVGNEPYHSRMISNCVVPRIPPLEHSEYLQTLQTEASNIENESAFPSDGSIRTDSFSGLRSIDEGATGNDDVNPSLNVCIETSFESTVRDVSE